MQVSNDTSVERKDPLKEAVSLFNVSGNPSSFTYVKVIYQPAVLDRRHPPPKMNGTIITHTWTGTKVAAVSALVSQQPLDLLE